VILGGRIFAERRGKLRLEKKATDPKAGYEKVASGKTKSPILKKNNRCR
jgi:hypothetical protein